MACKADVDVSNHARLQEAVFGHHPMIALQPLFTRALLAKQVKERGVFRRKRYDRFLPPFESSDALHMD